MPLQPCIAMVTGNEEVSIHPLRRELVEKAKDEEARLDELLSSIL
jgi:hypothetical protein